MPSGLGMLGKVKWMIKEYGKIAIGVYLGMWIVPFGTFYGICHLNNNFGQDPAALIEWAVGAEYRIKLWGMFGLEPDAVLSAATVSSLLAYIGAEVIETPRMMLTLYLAPKVKRLLTARAAAGKSAPVAAAAVAAAGAAQAIVKATSAAASAGTPKGISAAAATARSRAMPS